MKKIFSALMLMLMLIMTSCNKQEIFEMNDVLVIHLNDVAMSRAALVNDPKSVENTVNTLTVGVFASDGTVKAIRDFSSVGTGNSVTMRILNLNSTDKILCSINTPSGLFADVKNTQDFNNKEVSLESIVSKNGVDLIANNLVMYGEGPITQSSDSYVANIDMYHLNSKVSLGQLSTTIPNNGTFTPREIFLMNVPSSIKMSYSSPYTSTTYLCGALNVSIPNEAQNQYLGFGNINNAINQLFFYTSPNISDKYTKIVISGMFDPDGNGPMQQKMTYYPIVIDKNLLPNRNYILNIVIKGIGVDSPTQDLNYSNLKVNVNIQNFTDINKDIQLD